MNRSAKSSTDGQSFGQSLRDARLRKGWTAIQAAEKCGYSRSQWTNFELGNAFPPIDRIQEITSTLGLQLDLTTTAWLEDALSEKKNDQIRELLLSALRPSSGVGKERITLENPLPTPEGVDQGTIALIENIFHLVLEYRTGLTGSESNTPHIRLFQVEDDTEMKPAPHLRNVEMRPIGSSRNGLGYSIDLVRIDSGFAAQHRHHKETYVDSGMEFVVVLNGHGYVLLAPHQTRGPRRYPGQYRTLERNGWLVKDVHPSFVATYRGENLHVWANTGTAPLTLCVICVPFPPSATRIRPSATRKYRGRADARVFDLRRLPTTRIDRSLRRILLDLGEEFKRNIQEEGNPR